MRPHHLNSLYHIITLLLFFLHCQISQTTEQPNTGHPMVIQSDVAEFDDHRSIASYLGNVIIIKDDCHLKTNKLVIYKNKKINRIKQITAIGKPSRFHYQSNLQKSIGYGKANMIKYFQKKYKIYLINQAELEQDGNIIHGALLTYYLKKRLLTSQKKHKSQTTIILKPKKGNTL